MAPTLTTRWSAVVRCSRWLRAHKSQRNSSHLTQQCDERRPRFVHFLPFVFFCSSCCCSCDEEHSSQYRGARDWTVSMRLLNRWWSGRDSTPLRIGSSHSWNIETYMYCMYNAICDPFKYSDGQMLTKMLLIVWLIFLIKITCKV